MTQDELLDLIQTVQRFQSELSDVEVKAAQSGTPKRLYESLSAFANRTGGGVILLGLDENRAFEVAGVGGAHRIMEDVSSLAAENMEPALRPEFTLIEIQGKSVLAIEVFEVAPEQKPCFYKQRLPTAHPRGLGDGKPRVARPGSIRPGRAAQHAALGVLHAESGGEDGDRANAALRRGTDHRLLKGAW